jgi:gluconokinase
VDQPLAIILMGVSGSGKTAVGVGLAGVLQCQFLDGDNFHPPANVEKMREGVPLTDEDRVPWLENLHRELATRLGRGETVVLACSALKESYRSILGHALPQVRFVFLKVDKETLMKRLQNRHGHFFPSSLLESQLATLEPPKGAFVVEENRPLDNVVQTIANAATSGRL